MSIDSGATAKTDLRRAVMQRRREAHLASASSAAQAFKTHALITFTQPGKTIAGYWPLGDELDCRPALEVLIAAGLHVGLPVVAGQGQVLLFRMWRPGDALDDGPFGTRHPNPRAAILNPDVILVPLVAFDDEGRRLGYGAGFYDRTIAATRQQRAITAIGVAYACQEVPTVPTDPHDQSLDGVITEKGARWFGAA